MTAKQLIEALARQPARVWIQAVLGIVGFVVLAVLGFAVIAAVAVIGLVLILAFKARAWLTGPLGGRPPQPPAQELRRVTDVSYEIVDKKDDPPPR